jgi:hypothetical protein
MLFDRTFNVCITTVFSSRCKLLLTTSIICLFFCILFNFFENKLNKRTMIQKMMTIMIHYLRWIKDIELWVNDIMIMKKNKDQMNT